MKANSGWCYKFSEISFSKNQEMSPHHAQDPGSHHKCSWKRNFFLSSILLGCEVQAAFGMSISFGSLTVLLWCLISNVQVEQV